MANDTDSVKSDPCDIEIAFQGCSDRCVWGHARNSKLVSVEFGEQVIDNIQTQYRRGPGGWEIDFASSQAPSSADNKIIYQRRAAEIVSWLARPEETTIYEATILGNSYSRLMVSPRNRPKSKAGYKALDTRANSEAIKEELQMTALYGRYEIGKLLFGGNLNASTETVGTGAIFLPPVGGCGDYQCADAAKTYYEAHWRRNNTAGGNPYVAIVLDGVRQTNSVIDVALTTDDVVETPGLVVGDKLVIPFVNSAAPANGYFFAQILASGSLGPWARVAVGFPAEINAASTDGSGIYFATELTGGATGAVYVPEVGAGGRAVNNPTGQPLLKVHSNAGITLRTGTNLALMVSKPGDEAGRSVAFVLPVNVTAAQGDITSVWVVSANNWLIGTSQGRLFETTNAGASWNESSFGGAPNLDVSWIAASNDGQVRYVAQGQSLWRNVTAGSTCGSSNIKGWSQSNWMANFPTTGIGLIKAVVIPPAADRFAQANTLFVSFDHATVGVLIKGEPNMSRV